MGCDYFLQFQRLKQATQTRTDKELAAWLGCSASALARVKRRLKTSRGGLPPHWLLMLVEARGINPEWVRTGFGPREIAQVAKVIHLNATAAAPASAENCCGSRDRPCNHNTEFAGTRYETGPQARSRWEDEAALARLSSRALAEELLRRIALTRPHGD